MKWFVACVGLVLVIVPAALSVDITCYQCNRTMNKEECANSSMTCTGEQCYGYNVTTADNKTYYNYGCSMKADCVTVKLCKSFNATKPNNLKSCMPEYPCCPDMYCNGMKPTTAPMPTNDSSTPTPTPATTGASSVFHLQTITGLILLGLIMTALK